MDNGGNFLAFGMTMFWGFWGFLNDRDRTAQNLQFIRDRGCQYIRALGAVGPGGWSNRTIDPNMPDYQNLIGAFTDWVFDNFDMRVQWTIIGSTDLLPTSASRTNLINQHAAMAAGRENKIFAFEICNEAEGKLDLNELRSLTTTLQAQTDILVAASTSSGAACGGPYGLQAIYAAPVGDFVTAHFDRNVTGSCTIWRPVRQPWEMQFCSGIPILSSNNEPIGIQSSVAADSDPMRLCMGAAVTYLAGVGAYVLHTGAGIRGGGTEDLNVGRASNFFDYGALIDQVMQGMRNLRAILPSDTPNWTRHNTNNNFPGRPWDFNPTDAVDQGFLCRMYNADSGNQFTSMPIGINNDIGITAKYPMLNVDFWNVLSGTVVQHHDIINAGETVPLTTAAPAYIIRGQRA